MADLHSETGNHQDQVKVLIEKTASSLDDTALKMLFVSMQQNNIELCIECAIHEYVMISYCGRGGDLTLICFSLIEKIGIFSTVCPRHRSSNDHVTLNLIQEVLTYRTMIWFGHSFVSVHSIEVTELLFTLYGIVTSECQRYFVSSSLFFENQHRLIFVS